MNGKVFAIAALCGASLLAAAPAAAATELVVNGGFETWGLGANSDEFSTQYGPGDGQLQGWTTSGLAFVFVPGDPDAIGRFGSFSLWGPSNGVNNGLTTSSQGGNYIGSDADRNYGAPITQTLNGLVIGQKYNVSFEWAAAQQSNFYGDTTEAWEVYLTDSGNNQIVNFQTATLNNPEKGFQAWRGETFSFIATEASHALTFYANGGPGGLPPFALLDNVSVQAAVPEPSSWAMLITGFGLVGAAVRRRRSAAIAA
jgi:hypothetical protein